VKSRSRDRRRRSKSRSRSADRRRRRSRSRSSSSSSSSRSRSRSRGRKNNRRSRSRSKVLFHVIFCANYYFRNEDAVNDPTLQAPPLHLRAPDHDHVVETTGVVSSASDALRKFSINIILKTPISYLFLIRSSGTKLLQWCCFAQSLKECKNNCSLSPQDLTIF